MKIIPAMLFLALLISTGYGKTSPIEKVVPDFSLRSVNGEIITLHDDPNAKGFVIVFTCNHCPFAKLYSGRLNALQAKYAPLGIPVIAINSMDTSIYDEEGFTEMQRRSKAEHYTFPYVFDASQSVGKEFGADHTPEAFVIWKENKGWVIKYAGAVDNNGKHPEKATPYVANAIESLLRSRPIDVAESESVGCAIYYRETPGGVK